MEYISVFPKQILPCLFVGVIFAFTGHYFETKPQVIVIGILSLLLLYFYHSNDEDAMIKTDNQNLVEENENLKRNLMEVYAMVQQQKQSSSNLGPPPPVPPSMTVLPQGQEKEEDEDEQAKPYM